MKINYRLLTKSSQDKGIFDKNKVEAKLLELEKLFNLKILKDQVLAKKTVKIKNNYEYILNRYKKSKQDIDNLKDLYHLAIEEKNDDIIQECIKKLVKFTTN